MIAGELLFLIGTLLFGGITIYGFISGKMSAFYGFVRRDEDRELFWGWGLFNGCAAAMSLVGLVLFVLLSIYANP